MLLWDNCNSGLGNPGARYYLKAYQAGKAIKIKFKHQLNILLKSTEGIVAEGGGAAGGEAPTSKTLSRPMASLSALVASLSAPTGYSLGSFRCLQATRWAPITF